MTCNEHVHDYTECNNNIVVVVQIQNLRVRKIEENKNRDKECCSTPSGAMSQDLE